MRKKTADSNSDKVEYMEKIIRVFQWDSCAQVIAYLTIFGALTAKELSSNLNLKSEKSIYKTLNLLIETNFVKKQIEKDRIRGHSYISLFRQIHDPNFDKTFLTYLYENDKIHILGDYLNCANKASQGFLRVLNKIMTDKLKASDNQLSLQKFINNSTFFELIYEQKMNPDFKEKLGDFLQANFSFLKTYKPSLTGPMESPAAIYIAYMPFEF